LTIHRWLDDGIIAGEQFTRGAPWRIHLTDDLRSPSQKKRPKISHHVSGHAPAPAFPEPCGSVSSEVRSKPSEGGGCDLYHFADR
jgi:hypothetical protein